VQKAERRKAQLSEDGWEVSNKEVDQSEMDVGDS